MNSSQGVPVRRALISVSDKEGLDVFAAGLVDLGIEIYSTGGTFQYLEERKIPVKDVASYTGFPEMMDGRVKTLHPKIFAGILCRHDRQDDMQSLSDHEILSFELVVVNLYPFRETIAKPDVTLDEAIEKIDIGGPSLVRAAAKNWKFTSICTDKSQYNSVLGDLKIDGKVSCRVRQTLMSEAFDHTASYDQAISDYFKKLAAEQNEESSFQQQYQFSATRHSSLRYGENPHQQAAVYRNPSHKGTSLVTAKQLNGKGISYNNLLDLDAAFGMVRYLPDPSVVVIKHNNPCGASSAETIAEATKGAMEGDPTSAFGSILSFNRQVDLEAAEFLSTPGMFVEAIAAPSFSAEALDVLTTKPKWKKNVRLVETGPISECSESQSIRPIEGGYLVQQSDNQPVDQDAWKVVTDKQVPEELKSELAFAWAMVRHVKSNAIVLGKNRSLVGVGAGQMSRIDSVNISIEKAGDRAKGSVLASDAFFPFPDSIETASKAGIAAIIQPGGSVKDQEVIDACNRLGIPMVFTGIRHFRH